jgi:murein DD-endopeptidase MepM/ murein hydrolase activator NlpD
MPTATSAWVLVAGVALASGVGAHAQADARSDAAPNIEDRVFFPRPLRRQVDPHALRALTTGPAKPTAYVKTGLAYGRERRRWATIDGRWGRRVLAGHASRGGKPVPRLAQALPTVPTLTGALPPGLEGRANGAAPDSPLLRPGDLWLARSPPHHHLCAVCSRTRSVSIAERGALSPRPSRTAIASHIGDPLAALGPEEGQAAKQAAPEFIMPFAHGRVTSLFNQGRWHPAIDLAGAHGSAVLATTLGQKVVFAGWRGGYGYAVITTDGYHRTHLYGHLASIGVRVGQLLDQGERLGGLGSTGRSTGPHVHYEVKDAAGRHVDPVTVLFPGRRVGKGHAWREVRPEPSPVLMAKVSR